jgi:chorismate mutase / prephenate dehydratase
MDHSLRVQQELLTDNQNPVRRAELAWTIGYQGGEQCYSYMAAKRHFSATDREVTLRGFESFEQLLVAVRDGVINFAMLPIENTTAGSINDAYDLLARMNLALVGEEIQRVDHCLLGLPGASPSGLKRIYSHPQALMQCSEKLAVLGCRIESFTDTAMAVEKVRAEADPGQAAVASEEAGELHGLEVLERGLANQAQNYTRFVVVSQRPARYDERIPCKTSIILATRHEQGALLRCLNILASHDLNLTKLESRPRPKTPWEYLFYIDFEGNLSEQRTSDALRELASQASHLKVLGCYPARTLDVNAPAQARPQPLEESSEPTKQETVSRPVIEMLGKKAYKLVSRAERLEDTKIHVGGAVIGGDQPVMIAGPCSVESREQIMACAKAAREQGAQILRGGCFKPRTSPYAFQGLGYEGLDLLAEAGRAYELPVVTEVLHPSDVERIAEKSDILQIGARNMQNFPLLKAAGQVDRPVMLKRGMMASVDEWLNAAEYILAHGNQQVFLCERGIRTFETATRNTLDLTIVPVIRERTHLPIIVDPSHASGTWRYIPALAEAALASGAQGLMVEIHPKPEEALSDGPQALKFDTFERMMEQLRPKLNATAS